MSNFISIEQAKKMIALFKQQRENILRPEHQGKDLLVYSETFDRSLFDTILGKPGCQKVRIYCGMSDDLKVHALIVGVAITGLDVLQAPTPLEDPGNEVIEEGLRCPPYCTQP